MPELVNPAPGVVAGAPARHTGAILNLAGVLRIAGFGTAGDLRRSLKQESSVFYVYHETKFLSLLHLVRSRPGPGLA
jgi:hypothetical protein